MIYLLAITMILLFCSVFRNLCLTSLLLLLSFVAQGQGGRASIADSIHMHNGEDSSWYYSQKDLERAQVFCDSLRFLAEKWIDSLFIYIVHYQQGAIEKHAGRLIHTFAKKLKADVDIQGEQGTQVLLKIHAYKVA